MFDPDQPQLHQCPTNPKPSALPCSPHLPCTVALLLAFFSLHQSHGSQGLPVSLCWPAALCWATRPPLPVAAPPSSFHLHCDRLAVLVHEVQLLPPPVAGRFMSLGLMRGIRVLTIYEIRGRLKFMFVSRQGGLRHVVMLLLCNIQVLSVVLTEDTGSRNKQWQSGSSASNTRSVSSFVSNFLVRYITWHMSHTLSLNKKKG